VALTIFGAKAALLELLTELTWPGNQPEVRYGQPTEDEDLPFGGETVFLGESRALQEPPGLRDRGLDESYVLRFVVDLRQEGDSEQAAEARAWTLAGAGISEVWNNPTFASQSHRVTRVESSQVNQPLPGWWRTQIIVDVTVIASAIAP
jgi:hypothetical protein